jgi:hypothetical protein
VDADQLNEIVEEVVPDTTKFCGTLGGVTSDAGPEETTKFTVEPIGTFEPAVGF